MPQHIINDYTIAFFNQTLNGSDEPLLDATMVSICFCSWCLYLASVARLRKGELTTINLHCHRRGWGVTSLASHASREGAIGAVNNRVDTALSFLVKRSDNEPSDDRIAG